MPLRAESPLLVLALVEARFGEGTHETYQIPLGLRPAEEGWTDRVICETDGWTVYDALADAAHGRELLHRIRQGDRVPVEDGALRFYWAQSASAGAAGSVEVRPIGVEQSNSSIVFGESLILKVFRRVEPGVNPELELLRFLSERDFPHVAPLAGLVRDPGPPDRRDARHPAGVPGRRARRLGAGARRDPRRSRGPARPPARRSAR